MQIIHNLGLLSLSLIVFAAVLVIELAIANQIDKQRSVKRGRAVARPQ